MKKHPLNLRLDEFIIFICVILCIILFVVFNVRADTGSRVYVQYETIYNNPGVTIEVNQSYNRHYRSHRYHPPVMYIDRRYLYRRNNHRHYNRHHHRYFHRNGVQYNNRRSKSSVNFNIHFDIRN